MASSTDPRPTLDPAPHRHQADRAAIEALVANIELGFNTNDAERSCQDFTADAQTITAIGARVSGWNALLEAHRAGLAGPLGEQQVRYRVADIVFLRPDVAIAVKHAWQTSPDGAALTVDPAMTALYVVVKERGRWWIAARANSLVQPIPDT